MTLPKPFPYIDISEDYNPAIRLFGNRLISEQTILEYATEFLAIVFSEKKIASETTADPIPTLQMLKKWTSGQSLKYKPPIKLNLKLFAFFGLSRIDGKHEVHEQHYRYLIRRLGNAMTFNRGSSDQVLDYLMIFCVVSRGPVLIEPGVRKPFIQSHPACLPRKLFGMKQLRILQKLSLQLGNMP